MATQAASKPATSRQLAYINRLHSELGMKELDTNGDLSVSEASNLISELIPKARTNGVPSGQSRNGKVNEPRLGMAMKECFRLWKTNGWDIYGQHRKGFMRDAIKAYELFAEIAEIVERGEKLPPEPPL